MDIFKLAKSVTAREAADRYGLKVGRNGMACCPFHNDRTPSMKVDERFYCFGCGETGDAVDLTARLLDVGKRDAALLLISDFGLSEINYKTPERKHAPPPKEDPVDRELEKWREKAWVKMLDYMCIMKNWKADYAPEDMDSEWHPLYLEVMENEPRVRCILDELVYSSKAKTNEIREFYGEDIRKYEDRLDEFTGGVPLEDLYDWEMDR